MSLSHASGEDTDISQVELARIPLHESVIDVEADDVPAIGEESFGPTSQAATEIYNERSHLDTLLPFGAQAAPGNWRLVGLAREPVNGCQHPTQVAAVVLVPIRILELGFGAFDLGLRPCQSVEIEGAERFLGACQIGPRLPSFTPMDGRHTALMPFFRRNSAGRWLGTRSGSPRLAGRHSLWPHRPPARLVVGNLVCYIR